MNKAWIKMRRSKLTRLLSTYQLEGTLTAEKANGLAGALSELEVMDKELDRLAKESVTVPPTPKLK